MVLLSASPSDRSGNMKSKLNLLRMLQARLSPREQHKRKEPRPDNLMKNCGEDGTFSRFLNEEITSMNLI